MEKTIKYLENGEYHYATVKDVGDLAKLKTDSKDDLVTAINELFITGGEAPKKPDGYDELVDNVADAIQKQQQMTDTITNMQQSAQLSDAEMEHMKQVQEELHQEYLKAIKELNEAVDKAKADAADLDKKTSDLQDKLDETFASVDKEVSDVHKQLDSESAGLRKDLDDTKTSLESTRKDLLNNTQEFGVVNSEVKELKDKMDRRIWSTDLDPVREQVNKNTTEVSQTKDELKNKADQSSLDLVTNSVENLSTQVKENADGLKVSVKKDELGGDVARLLNDKTNLLLGTRNFSGDSWSNKTHWHEEPGYWKGLKVFSSTEMWSGLQYKYEVKQGQQYTFSFWARQEKDNSSASIVLSESDKGDQGIATPYVRGVHIGTEWKRYSLTFQAESDGIIYPRVEQNVQGNKLYIAGYKLELGSVATPWEPNEADVAENIEHNESQFNVYSDQIAGIVKKQEKMGDTERQLDTRITETAEGLKQTSKDLQDANGKITEFKGQLESTARGLKTEYEKYTNDAIGQISDSSLNLIRNSAFQNKDDNFAQWQNVSAKANIREDGNGLRWVELTQSGMTTDNPQGITSNYFVIKQGKVTVAVDIKLGDKANLDNQNILLLELYNDNKQRVDFTDVSVSQLGLSTAILNDHNVHRGLYRLGIDRKDVKYMTVKAILHRNGDLWLTNFSARLSSIDDGGYTPNPDDVNQQILKQNTKIEQDAEHIALKANSVDVTRDIKSAVDGIQVGGRNLVAGTNQEYIMGFGIPDTTWKDGFAYATLPTAGNGVEILPQDPHAFWYALTPGREYTQTIWFQTDATVKDLKAASITWFTNDGHDQQPATIQRIGLNSYKIFSSYKWPGKQHNNVRLFDISELRQAFDLKTGTYLKFGKLKLEEGNKSTSWAPAPEDISTEIKSAKDAAIQVASDQINIHVNELSTSFDDKLNKRVNEVKTASEKFTSDGIEQTVRKITNVKNDVDRLDQRVATNNGGGINLLRGTGSEWKTLTGSVWFCQTTGAGAVELGSFTTGDTVTYSITVRNNSQYAVRPEIVGFSDDNGTRSFNISGTESVQPGETKTVSVSATVAENTVKIIGWLISSGAEPTFSVDAKNEKLERGSVATPWSPNPQDAKTYTDSQIVNTNKKIDTQTLDSANIDQMKTQGHYFVHNLTGNPIGGWVYVDVIGNNNDRVRQDVYADQNNQHKYRSWNGSRWSDWEQGAYLSDVNSLKTEVTASVKNLGDRVTTEVNSITSKVNEGHSNDVELIRNSNFEDGNKGNWTDDSTTIISGNTIPSELGQDGMKVLRSVRRDIYEDGILYSVKPNETFDVDYWVWPTGNYDSQLGLCFWDNAKKIIDWRGVIAKKGTGWTHYTGTIQAPAKAAFAKPWFQINKDGSESASAAWMAKPSIRRHDNFADQKISEVNTKLDVANGQIQGKVTETQVQDLLNKGHYATQEWSQGQINLTKDQFNVDIKKVTDDLNSRVNEVKTASEKFTSDGIELTVKKITDVKDDVNNVNSKLDNLQVGTRNLLHHSDTFDGWHKGSSVSISSEKYLNGSVAVLQNSGSGGNALYSGLDVTNDEKHITWTVYARADNNGDKLHTELWGGGGLTDQPLTTEWKRYKFAGDHADTYNSFYLWGVNTNKGNIYVALPFAVVGNTIGSWSPNPDDVNQSIKDATEYKTVTGTIDFNNLKTQQKIFYKDTQATNTPAGGSYWYYLDVEPGYDGRILQTAISDRNNITWKRTFADSWSPWVKQADQRNIDDLNNQINGFKTETTASVKNLGDRVTTEVNSVTSKINNVDGKVNNMKIGGRNLLKGTRDFNSKYWYQSGDHTGLADNPTDSSTKEIHSWLDWHSYRNNQTIQLEPSKNYMISADIAIYDGDGNGLYVAPYGTVDGQASNLASTDVNLAGFPRQVKGEGFRRIYLPVTAHGRTLKDFRIEGHGNWSAGGGSVFISKIALYEGNTPLAWSDSSDDFVEAIKEVNTKWDVANGQIQGKVTATDVNNILNGKGYATQSWAESNFRMKSDSIDLEVKKITDPISNKLNNLQVGTRNLLHNTSDQWRTLTNNNGWLQQTTSSSCWTSVADYHGGDKFTYAAKITNNSHQQAELEGWLCDQNKNWINGQAFHAPIPKGANAYDVSVTFPITADTWYIRSWIIFTGGQAPNGDSVKVKDERLVEGATPGSWSPNPDDINQQITNTNNKIDTQTLDSANIDQMKTQGHYFVKNLTGNPIGGWVYVDVTGNNNDRLKQDVYQDNGYEHRSRRWCGSYWTEWTTDVNNKNIVSQINITPEQIKIASNKIVIDGNTDIHGVLDVKQVTLQGKNGNIDLSGDSGIKIGNNVGATLDLNSDGVNIAYKNEFKMDINSSHLALMQRDAATDQKEPVTIGIFKGGYTKGDNARAFLINYNPGSATDAQLHGADFMALGYTDPNNIGSSQSQIQLISRNFTSKKGVSYRKGVKFYDDITLQPYQKINIGDNDKEPDGKWTNDQLMIHRVNWKTSSQTDRYQPTIRLGWNSKTLGTAGVTFLWDQLKPFGNRDISDLGDIWFNGMKFAFGHVHHNRMFGGADQPAFMRIDPSNGSIMSGVAFTPGSTWDLGSGAWNITASVMNHGG